MMIFNWCFTLKADAFEQHYIQQWYFYFLASWLPEAGRVFASFRPEMNGNQWKSMEIICISG